MSTQFSSFLLSLQRRIGDSSTATELLLTDTTNAKIKEFEDKAAWFDLRDRFEFTTVSGTKDYTFTAINTNYNVENLFSLKEKQTLKTLKHMSLVRYEEINTGVTGSPTHYIPFTNTEFILYPTPNRNDVMTGYIQKKHDYMSAGSQYFELSDDKVEIIKYGVLSEYYLGKGDSRLSVYGGLWRTGMNSKAANLKKHLNAANARLLQEGSIE